MTKLPELSIEEMKAFLSKQSRKSDSFVPIGKDIFFFDSVSSTNTTAMKLAEKGVTEGAVVIADKQTAGKGRLKRRWVSPPGKNLYMSILIKPDISPELATILTLMISVACTSAIKRLSSIPISIKWPNDLIVSGRKLGGILVEIKTDMDRILHAVVGVGININLDIAEMPDNIKPIATSMKHETGESQSRNQVAIEVLKEIDKWYDILLKTGRHPILNEWLLLSSTIGRGARVTAENNTFIGVAEGIDDKGMLILKLSDNSFKKISAGDIIYT